MTTVSVIALLRIFSTAGAMERQVWQGRYLYAVVIYTLCLFVPTVRPCYSWNKLELVGNGSDAMISPQCEREDIRPVRIWSQNSWFTGCWISAVGFVDINSKMTARAMVIYFCLTKWYAQLSAPNSIVQQYPATWNTTITASWVLYSRGSYSSLSWVRLSALEAGTMWLMIDNKQNLGRVRTSVLNLDLFIMPRILLGLSACPIER